jgi:hypothetical protein
MRLHCILSLKEVQSFMRLDREKATASELRARDQNSIARSYHRSRVWS